MKTTNGTRGIVCILLIAVCVFTAVVPAFAGTLISIDPIEQVEGKAGLAVIEVHEGEMTHEGQKDIYTLTVPEDGRVRLEMGELYGNARVTITVYDRLGETVATRSYAGNGDGITLKGLKAGETYEIRVCQEEKLSKYILYIGMPKAELDISEVTSLVDWIEYTDQRNPYTFTVERDGRVRLEFCNMRAEIRLTISVFNRLGEQVATRSYASNGDGITLTGLKAGETYSVIVFYEEGFGEYTLLIGKQKAPVECSAGSVIVDSIEHTDQRNVYMLTADADGDLTFTLEEVPYGNAVCLRIFNRLGENVGTREYMTNGNTYTLKNVKAGETYQIQIVYDEGLTGYQLRID